MFSQPLGTPWGNGPRVPRNLSNRVTHLSLRLSPKGLARAARQRKTDRTRVELQICKYAGTYALPRVKGSIG